MAKTTISVTVDTEVIRQLRELKINVSNTFNEMAKQMLYTYDQDIDGLDVRMERIKAEKYLKKLNHYQALYRASQTRMEKFDEIMKKKESERIKKEKEELEKQKRCLNCGNLRPDDHKWHQFKRGNICNACFLTANKVSIIKWNGDGEVR